MVSSFTLDRLRRNDPKLQDLDVLLRSDTTCDELEALIQALQQNRTLRSASVWYEDSQLAETAVAAAVAATIVNDQYRLQLALHEALGSVPSLRVIFIDGKSFPIVAATRLLESAKKCEKLYMCVNNFVGESLMDQWDHFVSTLRQHQHLKIVSTSTRVFYMGIPSGGRRNILQNNFMQALATSATLKSVSLNGIGANAVNLSLESVGTLCQSSLLTRLWLHDFTLTDDHLTIMESSFRQNHSQQLKVLSMSSCTLGTRGLEALANIVSATSQAHALSAYGCAVQLEELSLWITQMPLVDDSQRTWDGCTNALLRLATALQDSSIRKFRMEAPKGTVAELKASVPSTENMQDPNTPRNRHRHPIASSLVQSAFSQVLEYNISLESYFVLCCPESNSYHSEMELYLKLNKLGRGRLLGATRGSSLVPQNDSHGQGNRAREQLPRSYQVRKEDWINVLGNARDDLSCIYYFLSANPLLCIES